MLRGCVKRTGSSVDVVTTLMSGGVRVPGGLRRLQSGWDE